MFDSLKSMTNVIIESKSVSRLLGVQLGDHLHMFSSIFLIENQNELHMFTANRHDKTFQLMWLQKQYEKRPDLW